MNYGFSDGNLGATTAGMGFRVSTVYTPPKTPAELVALQASVVFENERREAYRAAVAAETAAITEEQKAAAQALRANADSYDDVLIRGLKMGDASLTALSERTNNALNQLYYDVVALRITPEQYSAQAKILNDNYEAESNRLLNQTMAAAEKQAALTTQALYDQGASDAKYGGLSVPKTQLDADRQEIYNMGFFSISEADKYSAPVETATPVISSPVVAVRAAQPAPVAPAEQYSANGWLVRNGKIVQPLQRRSAEVSVPLAPVAVNTPLQAAPVVVSQPLSATIRPAVSDSSMPTETISNPVAALRGSGPLTLVSAPPMASVPAYAPMTNSLTASQTVQQASIGGADLKTVAMIAFPLIVLGLILRR